MALQKQIELESGITLPNAYFRVTEFFMSYVSKLARFELSCYADQASRLSGKKPIKITTYEVLDNAQPEIQAVYQFVVAEAETIQLSVLFGEDTIEVEGANAQEIFDQLNTNATFSANWIANYHGGKWMSIAAKADGQYRGENGNGLVVSGDVFDFRQVVVGKAAKASDFETYFCIASLETANPIKQCYVYLKTQNEYADALDILETE